MITSHWQPTCNFRTNCIWHWKKTTASKEQIFKKKFLDYLLVSTVGLSCFLSPSLPITNAPSPDVCSWLWCWPENWPKP